MRSRKRFARSLPWAAITVAAVLAGEPPPLRAADAVPCDASALARALKQARTDLEQEQSQAWTALRRKPPRPNAQELARRQRLDEEATLRSMATFPGVTAADLQAMRRSLEEKQAHLKDLPPPTEFEDIERYRTMMIVVGQMVDASRRFEATGRFTKPLINPARIVFGTIPGGVNASTKTVNYDERNKACRVYRVTLNSGLLQFASAFSDILARALPPAKPLGSLLGVSMSPDAVETYLDVHPEVTRAFTVLMTSYLRDGVPGLETENEPLQEPYATLAAMMYRSMLVFALGHELGHVANDEAPIHWMSKASERLPPKWVEEYQADAWGVMLSIVATGRGMQVEAALLGAAVYFVCYDLLEKGASLLTTGYDFHRAKERDYPAAYRRLEILPEHAFGVLREFFGRTPASVAEINQLLSSMRMAREVALALWSRALPALRQLYADKVPLSPAWSALAPRK
jgi:hypothetical protein